MERPSWEVAGAQDSGLSALFKGASLISKGGEAVSVLSALKNRTALLYFAAGGSEGCRSFNKVLCEFYDVVKQSDDSITVIFVSSDKSREEQLAFFAGDGVHAEWFMVEWTPNLEELAKTFEVEQTPRLLVMDQHGRAVGENGLEQVLDMMEQRRCGSQAVVAERWAEWRRLAGTWRPSGGHALGGGGDGGASSSSCAAAALPPSAAPAPELGGALGAPGATGALAGAASDREALRAARLAAFDRRMGDGGVLGGSGASHAGASSSSGFAQGAAASGSSSSAPLPAVPLAALGTCAGGSRIATLGSSGGASSSAPAPFGGGSGAGGGTGSFAVGQPAVGGAVYTLAGGRIELPPPPPSHRGAGEDRVGDEDMFSDMASDGDRSMPDEVDVPLPGVTLAEGISQMASMGFPEDSARGALEASNGDVDAAVALLLDG